jgi:hypothetical protein
MKEPCGKGLATRPDPESCAGRGNTTGEALPKIGGHDTSFGKIGM